MTISMIREAVYREDLRGCISIYGHLQYMSSREYHVDEVEFKYLRNYLEKHIFIEGMSFGSHPIEELAIRLKEDTLVKQLLEKGDEVSKEMFYTHSTLHWNPTREISRDDWVINTVGITPQGVKVMDNRGVLVLDTRVDAQGNHYRKSTAWGDAIYRERAMKVLGEINKIYGLKWEIRFE